MKATITCKHCQVADIYDVKKNKKGEGAGYVKEWDHLPDANMKLLTWLVSNHPLDWWESVQIINEYRSTTPGPLLARVSELVGLGLLQMQITKKDKQKTAAAYNTTAILYRVNLIKASAVINASGILKQSGVALA